jgi:hypothetical protein
VSKSAALAPFSREISIFFTEQKPTHNQRVAWVAFISLGKNTMFLPAYMDAPCCQAFLFGFVSQELIAAIHPACLRDAKSLALMEYAG